MIIGEPLHFDSRLVPPLKEPSTAVVPLRLVRSRRSTTPAQFDTVEPCATSCPTPCVGEVLPFCVDLQRLRSRPVALRAIARLATQLANEIETQASTTTAR